jgi:hypothetical protein
MGTGSSTLQNNVGESNAIPGKGNAKSPKNRKPSRLEGFLKHPKKLTLRN